MKYKGTFQYINEINFFPIEYHSIYHLSNSIEVLLKEFFITQNYDLLSFFEQKASNNQYQDTSILSTGLFCYLLEILEHSCSTSEIHKIWFIFFYFSIEIGEFHPFANQSFIEKTVHYYLYSDYYILDIIVMNLFLSNHKFIISHLLKANIISAIFSKLDQCIAHSNLQYNLELIEVVLFSIDKYFPDKLNEFEYLIEKFFQLYSQDHIFKPIFYKCLIYLFKSPNITIKILSLNIVDILIKSLIVVNIQTINDVFMLFQMLLQGNNLTNEIICQFFSLIPSILRSFNGTFLNLFCFLEKVNIQFFDSTFLDKILELSSSLCFSTRYSLVKLLLHLLSQTTKFSQNIFHQFGIQFIQFYEFFDNISQNQIMDFFLFLKTHFPSTFIQIQEYHKHSIDFNIFSQV
jgi:hypothetical protein